MAPIAYSHLSICPKRSSASKPLSCGPAVQLSLLALIAAMADHQDAPAQAAAVLQHNAEGMQPQEQPQEQPREAPHVDEWLEEEQEVPEDAQSMAAASVLTNPVVDAAREQNLRAQREIVESVSSLVSQQPAMSAELLMLRQEDIQKFAVTLTSAPAAFKRRYDTKVDFSCALAGYNFVMGSFFRGGVKTREAEAEICGGAQSSSIMA